MAAEPASWTLEDLRVHLQAAVELELLVIPPYLCALYSLRPGSNDEVALIIRSVVVEEMLHMILAANVLNAVGGAPTVAGGDWVPRYPSRIPYRHGRFELGLRAYGDEALDAFLAIENPSHELGSPAEPDTGAATPRLATLGSYRTIGAFYEAIEHGLRELVGALGEDAVFTGPADRQVGAEHYYASGGRAIEVTCLEHALAALDEIVEQGEGELTKPPAGEKFDPSRDLAHYYRFNELRLRRRYRVGDLPETPTGEPIHLDRTAVYPMKPNLCSADLATPELRRAIRACNVIWTRLLLQLETALTGSPGELRAAVATMFQLKNAARTLLRIPLPGDEGGWHAGPTFEIITGQV